MIFDTHAHYDDEDFDLDRDLLLSQMKQAGVERIVNVGASLQGCKDTIALTEQYDFIYGAIGIHPCDTENLTETDMDWLLQESKREKILAIGEIGLDYYWDEPDREIQKKWFERQLNLAREANLPVIIHSREAAKDTLDMMKALHAEEIGGVVHCFSYGKEMAREYLDMGFYFGIGGVVTFKNSKKLKEVVEYLPMDRIVIETDCPYLSPEPNRGKRNSSLNLPYVVKAIAQLKGLTEEEVMKATYENGLNLYWR